MLNLSAQCLERLLVGIMHLEESFFGHMKDEIGDKIAKCKTFYDVFNVIVDYMDYYNNYRYQWDLAKLAPAEYYEYYMTGIYPLPKGNNKNQIND